MIQNFGMHAVRLLTSAIEILETGDYCTYRPNKDFLLDIRAGKYTLDECLDIIDYYDNQLQEAFEKSKLPETCDFNKINEWLIQFNRKALDYDWDK